MATFSVLANKLNLRARPIDGDILAVLSRGHLVDDAASADGTPPGWRRVVTHLPSRVDPVDGWVAAQYVAPYDTEPLPAPDDAASTAVTGARLARLTPTGSKVVLAGVEGGFGTVAPQYGISTVQRICHFIAQAAHETMGFTRLSELGGTAYFTKLYEGRKSLGNTEPGDGARFHGRGIFQLTGRANYAALGARVGEDLIAHPDRAMDPEVSFKLACIYWTDRGLNDKADHDDIVGITRRINGGLNGLEERKRYYRLARAIWV